MDDQNRVPDPKLSFWMDGAEAQKLCRAARNFWQCIADAATWPARQMNPLECSPPILDLIAWQRCIARHRWKICAEYGQRHPAYA